MQPERNLFDISCESRFGTLDENLKAGSLSLAFVPESMSKQANFSADDSSNGLGLYIGPCAIIDLSAAETRAISQDEMASALAKLKGLAEKLSGIYGVKVEVPVRLLIKNSMNKRTEFRLLTEGALRCLSAEFRLIGVESTEFAQLTDEQALGLLDSHNVACLLNLDLTGVQEEILCDLYAAPLLVPGRLKPVRPVVVIH